NDGSYGWRAEWTPDWRYEWYKGTDSVMLQTSERYTVNRDTLTIRGVTTSDQDQYWCKGQRDERPKSSHSSSVSLNVTDSPRSTLTVTPDSPVFTGETVNLKCVIESYSDWRYEWYEGTDSVMLQTSERYTVNRDTLTIRGATESDAGQYWCRGQRDERPNSSQSSSVSLTVTVSRSGQISVFNILSFLLAACPYLLATVVLLFKCYRARVTSIEDQSQ
ncbi:Fc receptor-like protein 2, partial [Sinocyclocheilus anshuiensis]|uniref:Fc receptor-like protein 2 n=1 Tax=Sinocyclocheilus anshuiensis TaxID=1608454 RepID=UPI0007B8E570